MKHIFLNLKRFDVPVELGGVNRLAPVAEWGRAIVAGTQQGLTGYDPAEAEFVDFFPEAHLIPAAAARTADSRVELVLGTLIQKIPQTKTVFICTISAFTLYVVGVYFQYEWRKLLLPVVSVLVVESVIMLPLHIGSLGKWFRSMSTLLFLCHYIFVRAFECFPTLAVCFPEGIHKFMFVGVSAFLLSALLVWAGNKNKRIRWLWQ